MNFPKIYLASGSPRRRELLSQIKVDFEVLAVEIDETQRDNEEPAQYVQRVAVAKAQAGFESLHHRQLAPVLGADTSVIVDGKILGKPQNDDDAFAMLRLLSGRSHQVMTTVAVVTALDTHSLTSKSTVDFSILSDSDIVWYLSTKEGHDKAGSYAVQGQAAQFIDNINGSYSGIMGLPLREASMLLKQLEGYQNE
jgi:septum formation protein